MNSLKKKTFVIIFLIFTSFLLLIISFNNIQYYNREYNNIKNNLLRVNNMFVKNNSFNNRIIMDYNIYSVYFDSNDNIISTYSHTSESSNLDIDAVAKDILSKDEDIGYKISILYFSKYAYRLDKNSLVIIDTNDVNTRLINNLLLSLGLFLILELVVFYITRLITNYLIKPAEMSFKKQKEFIADASHELKTPVAVIMASVDALEKETNQKYVQNIKNETERMNNLITSLLDLSKLESDENKLIYKEENISKIVEKSTLTFESIAFEKNVVIDNYIDEDVKMKCNPVEISEVLSILLDNAIKHSENDSHIKVTLKSHKNDIKIEVINKGEEIKKEDEEKVFERFYRVDKGRNRSAGRYGLGLAIAKKIVTNHNGKIRCYSLDGYTTFEILFKK